MKQLNVFEMEAISGGTSGFLNNAIREIGAIGIGASIGATFGAIIGGRWGGDGGGVIGFGAIGQLVGMLGGLAIGAVTIGAFGAIVGYDATYDLSIDAINGLIDGTFNVWSGGSKASINSLIDMVLSYL